VTAPAFVRYNLAVEPAAYDRAVSALLELPASGWQEDAGGQRLTFWLEEGAAAAPAVVRTLQELEALGRLETAPERDDWQTSWRRFHQAIRVGDVCVRPPWEPAAPGLLDVVIDVGMAFGTGSHASTRQCLAALQDFAPASLLDLGTGSGVLALAALRLGFAPVHACDNDEFALRAAAKNARLNGLALHFLLADLTDPTLALPTADVVLANVALKPIAAYGRRLASGPAAAAPRHVVLAGLLATQVDEARAAYRQYAERQRRQEGEWVQLTLERAG
jgi:ribosomal protein L11 methyltransferase